MDEQELTRVDDLVGAHEIAERLGRSSSKIVHTWHRQHADFPAPVRHLSMGIIWDWKEVEQWYERFNVRKAANWRTTGRMSYRAAGVKAVTD